MSDNCSVTAALPRISRPASQRIREACQGRHQWARINHRTRSCTRGLVQLPAASLQPSHGSLSYSLTVRPAYCANSKCHLIVPEGRGAGRGRDAAAVMKNCLRDERRSKRGHAVVGCGGGKLLGVRSTGCDMWNWAAQFGHNHRRNRPAVANLRASLAVTTPAGKCANSIAFAQTWAFSRCRWFSGISRGYPQPSDCGLRVSTL